MYNYQRIKDTLSFSSRVCVLLVWLVSHIHGQAMAQSNPGGIPNLGNTCYLNAAMQVIAKLYPETFKNSNTDLAKAGRVIVKKIKSDQGSVTRQEAQTFFNALRRTGWPKDGGSSNSQQDAEEFFSYLLGHFNTPKRILLWQLFEYIPTGQNSKIQRRVKETSADGLAGYRILPMIAGLSRADTNRGKSLQSYVDTFLAEETVDYRGAIPGTAKKSYQIQNPPHLFAIQAKRFIQDSTNRTVFRKASERIARPSSFTLKAQYQHDPKGATLRDARYQLQAFVVHEGSSMHSGHYIAYVKLKGKWKKYDDSTVSNLTVAEAEMAAQKAYLYFFRRSS